MLSRGFFFPFVICKMGKNTKIVYLIFWNVESWFFFSPSLSLFTFLLCYKHVGLIKTFLLIKIKFYFVVSLNDSKENQ